MLSRLRSLIASGELFAWGTLVLVLVGIAVFTYGRGVADWRYQLADLKEDPLYLRGPGPSVTPDALSAASTPRPSGP